MQYLECSRLTKREEIAMCSVRAQQMDFALNWALGGGEKMVSGPGRE